jgi:hypothetical protein
MIRRYVIKCTEICVNKVQLALSPGRNGTICLSPYAFFIRERFNLLKSPRSRHIHESDLRSLLMTRTDSLDQRVVSAWWVINSSDNDRWYSTGEAVRADFNQKNFNFSSMRSNKTLYHTESRTYIQTPPCHITFLSSRAML